MWPSLSKPTTWSFQFNVEIHHCFGLSTRIEQKSLPYFAQHAIVGTVAMQNQSSGSASDFILHNMWSDQTGQIRTQRLGWFHSIVQPFVFFQSFNRWLHLRSVHQMSNTKSTEHDIHFTLINRWNNYCQCYFTSTEYTFNRIWRTRLMPGQHWPLYDYVQ